MSYFLIILFALGSLINVPQAGAIDIPIECKILDQPAPPGPMDEETLGAEQLLCLQKMISAQMLAGLRPTLSLDRKTNQRVAQYNGLVQDRYNSIDVTKVPLAKLRALISMAGGMVAIHNEALDLYFPTLYNELVPHNLGCRPGQITECELMLRLADTFVREAPDTAMQISLDQEKKLNQWKPSIIRDAFLQEIRVRKTIATFYQYSRVHPDGVTPMWYGPNPQASQSEKDIERDKFQAQLIFEAHRAEQFAKKIRTDQTSQQTLRELLLSAAGNLQKTSSAEVTEAIEHMAIAIDNQADILRAFAIYIDRLDMVEIGCWLRRYTPRYAPSDENQIKAIPCVYPVTPRPDSQSDAALIRMRKRAFPIPNSYQDYKNHLALVLTFNQVEIFLPGRYEWNAAIELATKSRPSPTMSELLNQNLENTQRIDLWMIGVMGETIVEPDTKKEKPSLDIQALYPFEQLLAKKNEYQFHSWFHQITTISDQLNNQKIRMLKARGIRDRKKLTDPTHAPDEEYLKTITYAQHMIHNISRDLFKFKCLVIHELRDKALSNPGSLTFVHMHGPPNKEAEPSVEILNFGNVNAQICYRPDLKLGDINDYFSYQLQTSSTVNNVVSEIVIPSLLTFFAARVASWAARPVAEVVFNTRAVTHLSAGIENATARSAFLKQMAALTGKNIPRLASALSRQFARASTETLINLVIFVGVHKAELMVLGISPFWDSTKGFWGNFGESIFAGGLTIGILQISAMVSAVTTSVVVTPVVREITVTASAIDFDTLSFVGFHLVYERMAGKRKSMYFNNCETYAFWTCEEAQDSFASNGFLASLFVLTSHQHATDVGIAMANQRIVIPDLGRPPILPTTH